MKLDIVFFKKQLPVLAAVIVVILAIRSSIIEPFRIPTRSMLPGLMMGDFLFANKMEYGFHLPFSETFFTVPIFLGNTTTPKRGDIVIFAPPEAGQENLYIKRIVAVAGDKIHFVGKTLWLNDKPVSRLEITGEERDKILNHRGFDPEERYEKSKLHLYLESPDLGTHSESGYHVVEDDTFEPRREQKDLVVPENNYFVLGDNRDDTRDSRNFGVIPFRAIRGRAFVIWFSYRTSMSDSKWSFRSERIGKLIQ